MRLKVLLKPHRPVALSVDEAEAVASVEVIVVAVADVAREAVAVAVAEEGLLGHIALFVSSLMLGPPTNLRVF